MEHHYVYIMASLSRRIYVGVTNDVFRRVLQHKAGQVPGFTRRYRMHRLVYLEEFRYIGWAIVREKQIKGWRRSRKVELIEARNPTWADLAEDWRSSRKKEQVPHPTTGLGMTVSGRAAGRITDAQAY